MNDLPPSNHVPGLVRVQRFPDFEVSWAGSLFGRGEEFCFGSEDGKLIFTDARMIPVDRPIKASQGGLCQRTREQTSSTTQPFRSFSKLSGSAVSSISFPSGNQTTRPSGR
jgi:hypothetical protein